MSNGSLWTRREAIRAAIALGLSPAALHASEDNSMQTRPIPSSGEALPVIGLGTYDVFDVSGSPDELTARREIVDALLEQGGSVIDSSPMYNRSEDVVGRVLDLNGRRQQCFLATKVWTDGKRAGEMQMNRSIERMGADVMDLMQVHNLRDLDTQFGTLVDWQSDGRIRYHGITHYRADAMQDMETAMKRHRPHFIQINYSLGERSADERLLPLAADRGIAVLINRPFVAGQLFAAVRGHDVPDWAREYADSWGRFFLKFILGHGAVSCVIPATSKPRHMADNLGAGFGPLPDAATRARMVRLIESL